MRPGPNLIRAMGVLAALALLVPILGGFFTICLLGGTLAALLVAFYERWLLGRIKVTHEEQPVFVLSLDEEEEISFKIATDSKEPVRVVARRMWPEFLDRPSSTVEGIIQPGEVLKLTCEVRAIERGTAPVDGPHLAMTMWGWGERIVSVPHQGEMKVLPSLRAVRRLHDRLNDYSLRGMGQRIAPRLGKGREFDRLREYNDSDDFRDIAWKASARHSKLIVREYRIDRSQDVLVCLDRGHRMAALTTRIRRIDHAVNASLLVSYICNRMEDRVGVLSFGAQVDRGVPQGRGATHLSRVTEFAARVRAEYIHTDYLGLAAHVRRRLSHRAIVLIVTTLPEAEEQRSLVKMAAMLAPSHLPVVIVLSDPALQAAAHSQPANHAELSRTLVARDVWLQRKGMMEELRRLGAWVVDTGPEDVGIDAVNAYLEIKRRQLI